MFYFFSQIKTRFQQFEEVRSKHESEVSILRKEREALEDVISSLRAECDTLKTSLNREYETNENIKKQLNKLTKTAKQSDEVFLMLKKIFL